MGGGNGFGLGGKGTDQGCRGAVQVGAEDLSETGGGENGADLGIEEVVDDPGGLVGGGFVGVVPVVHGELVVGNDMAVSPVEQSDEYHALFGDLVALEAYRRSLLEQASGDDISA